MDEDVDANSCPPHVARQITVIQAKLRMEGAGTADDPMRLVEEYFSQDGTLLAAVDPLAKSVSRKDVIEVGRKIKEYAEKTPNSTLSPESVWVFLTKMIGWQSADFPW
jgi:hypothetical protein